MAYDIDDNDLDNVFPQDEEEEFDPEERERFDQIAEEIRQRAESNGIEFKQDEGGDLGVNYDVLLPEGRKTRLVTLWDVEDAKTLKETNFENISFVEDYFAFYSKKTKMISASVSTLRPINSVMRREADAIINSITGKKPSEKGFYFREKLYDDDKSPEIALIKPPYLHRLLTRGSRCVLSLIIFGTEFSTNEEAKEKLEKIGNSFFFQIEQEIGVPLTLVRSGRSQTNRIFLPPGNSDRMDIQFPRIEYDRDPMTFYWYAVGASMMPLMQYLAFYQAIEYYLPICSQRESARKVRQIIRQPNFKSHRDTDIQRIISAVNTFGGTGVGSELSQLKATLIECVPEEDLREFLEHPNRKEFFVKGKQVKARKLSIESKKSNILEEVAERIYQIRCRIVHSKASDDGNEQESLLPFTHEERSIGNDIELIQFVAGRVIAANGGDLAL